MLHNNAYWSKTGVNVLTTTEEQWDKTMEGSLKSMYLMSRAVVPRMVAQGSGSIINMASVAGIVGSSNFTAYAAAKGAVIALTKSMATDFGKQGIRVNCIAPGPILTPSLQKLVADPAWLARQMGRILLDRLGKPEDVASAVRCTSPAMSPGLSPVPPWSSMAA